MWRSWFAFGDGVAVTSCHVAVWRQKTATGATTAAGTTAVMAVAGAAAAALAAESQYSPPSMRAHKKEFFMPSRELREAADQPNWQRLTRDLAGIECPRP